MKNWEEDDGTEYCTAKESHRRCSGGVRKAGYQIAQPILPLNIQDYVFEHFLHEYRAGRTPNPDILCSKKLNLKAFLEYAETGCRLYRHRALCPFAHFVDNHTQLLRGLDANKDQSYFLHAVSEQQLSKTMFPIGELEKPKSTASRTAWSDYSR
ncbi:MAG: hypothetical protein R3E74_03250 [Pseudomonadales bacterium]